MQHIHLHLSNASQQGTRRVAPVKTTSLVRANTSVAYATANFETINTFEHLIRKIIDNYVWAGNLSVECSIKT